jgi:tetratricopeptide (TPR) repeat protein
MTRVEKTVFLSYRRTNAPWALAISQGLTHSGFDVFFDYQGIASGDFERIILESIRARAHFLVLLTPSALQRCDTPGDWLQREIEEALETRRNIVPLMLEGFDFGSPVAAPKLTGKLTVLRHYNGLTVPAEYFDAAMTKLRDKFLNVPLDAVLHPASAFAQQAAKAQQTAAAAAPLVQEQELTAQEWIERGFNARDLDEQIRCYTEAIRLKPDNEVAYLNRGGARGKKGDSDGAIEDSTEAIRLKPDDADAYNNRGNARADKGDFDGAIKDFEEAIRLRPDDEVAYLNRGRARGKKGDSDGAIEDSTEAIRLKPNYADAYYNRGCIFDKKGDFDGAVKDYTEAIRLNPDHAAAYNNRGSSRGKKDDFDGTVEDCTEAIRLDSDNAEAYHNRGLARANKGDLDGAMKDYAEAIRLKPAIIADAYNNIGRLGHMLKLRAAQRDFDDTKRSFN